MPPIQIPMDGRAGICTHHFTDLSLKTQLLTICLKPLADISNLNLGKAQRIGEAIWNISEEQSMVLLLLL